MFSIPTASEEEVPEQQRFEIEAVEADREKEEGEACRKKTEPQEEEQRKAKAIEKAATEEADRIAAAKLEEREKQELEACRKKMEAQEQEQRKAKAIEKAATEEADRIAAAKLEDERLRKVAEQDRLKKEAEDKEKAEQEYRKEAELRTLAEKLKEEQEKVASFLKKEGFSGINEKRKSMIKWKNAIHSACKSNDPGLVQALIGQRADPDMVNSSGQNAVQVCKKHNKNGSHDGVLKILKGLGAKETNS